MKNKWMCYNEIVLLFLNIYFGIVVLLLLFTSRKVDFYLKLLFILMNKLNWMEDKS